MGWEVKQLIVFLIEKIVLLGKLQHFPPKKG